MSGSPLPATPDVDTWEEEPGKFDEFEPIGTTREGPKVAGPDDGGQASPRAALRFRSAAELIEEPPPVAVIDGIAWAGRITVLASESGAGKTFVLLDAAAHVVNGETWHGRRVRRGSVAYVSFEGDAFALRLQPLKDAGLSLDDLHLVRAGDPLSPRVGRDGVETYSFGEAAVTEALAELAGRLQREGRPPLVLVVVDTVRASLAGSEDNSEHVSGYLRAIRRIMAPLSEAAVILAHHAGWQDGEQKRKRERGSSAFRGNADATLYLEVAQDDPDNGRAFLELKTLKVRDAERPAPLRLIRQRMDVAGFDDFGNPLSSCGILPDARRREDQEAAAAAAVKAADQEQDIRTLRVIADRPELATSQERVRQLLGVGKAIVSASVARLIRAGLIIPGRRGEPYTLTREGSLIVTAQDQKA